MTRRHPFSPIRHDPEPRPARARDRMTGPKLAAVAILAAFALSILFLHRIYDLEVPAAAAASLPVAASFAEDGPLPAPPAREAARAPLARSAPAPLKLPVQFPVPAPAIAVATTPGSAGPYRDVNDCVERRLTAAGQDEVKPTLPGRWPALKRAREERRLRRLAATAECERELAR